MMSTFYKVLRIALGVVCLLLGVAGLFLPILQGVLFLIIGFYLLSREIPAVRRLWLRLEKKYPRAFDRWRQTKHNLKTRYHTWRQKPKSR